MNKVSIIIPVYNEEYEVAKVINGIKSLKLDNTSYEIIAVNDASTDNSLEELNKINGITVLNNQVNSGYGASLKRGIKSAKFENIAICDADNTYPVTEITDMLLNMDKYAMVVGKRKKIVYPSLNILKQAGRLVIDLYCSYLAGSWIPDINSGLRIFKKKIAEDNISLLCERFSFTTSLTLIMFSNNHKVLYKDIDYCLEPTNRNSKVKMLSDGYKTLLLIFKHGMKYHPAKNIILILLDAVLIIAVIKLIF